MSMTSTIQPIAFSPKGASQRVGISVRGVYTLIALGELRSFKVGKRRLIPASELTRFIEMKLREAV
jgi:excisionase family DNA binding protein